MRVKTLLYFLTMIMVMFAFIGCDDVPQQEIDDANSALAAAKTAEADKYVADKFNAAKQALDRAMAVVQEEESAMFSNFDEARTLLATAKTAADEAAAAVSAKKEEVKQAAESALAGIPAEVATTEKMWRSAPRGKGTREALAMMKEEIDRTAAMQSQVQAALDGGDYLGAQQKAMEISGKLKSLQGELQR
jgi:ABC-type transporter Mla subunit MlaD